MNARNILARAIAVGATAVVVATGLPTASWAAGSASVISGSPVLNEGSHTAVFGTSTPYPPSPVGPDVQLVRHADSSDTIDDSSSSVDSNGHVVATFDLSNANPGAYDVNIGQANTQTWSDQCTSCFTIVAFHPTVSSVSPAALGGAALYQPFVISGQHFTKGVALSSGTGYVPCVTSTGSACGGPTVAILKHGTDTVDPDVTLTQTVDSNGNSAPTSTTPTAITMRAGVVSTAVAHVDDVLVTNTDGKTGLCAGCLTIGPRPVVSSVLTSPNNTNEIGQGATNATVVVTGTNFSTTDLLAVAFHGPSSNSGAITYKSESAPVNVGGGNQAITLTGVDTTGVTTTGAWTVTVFDSTLHTSSAAVPFPVNAPPNPNAITYGDSSKSAYGVGAQLVHLTVTDKSGAPFTAGSGTGTGFTRIVFPSGLPTGVTVGPSQSASGGAVSAVLSIAQNTPVTSKIPVALVNPDGGQAACDDSIFNGGLNPQNSCFLNIEAGPGITSVSPNTVASGSASGPITIKGTNFNTGAGNTVHVTIGPAQAPWFDSAVTPTNATTLTVPNVAVPVGTAVGNYDVTVRNDTDKGTFTAPGAFHVASLSVSGVSDPNPLNDPGDNPDTMTVNGNNFASGATVTLTKAGLPTITGTVNSVNANGHSLSATFNFTNVAPGPYDVNVTNPSNSSFPGTASCPGCLTVVASAPSISNVNPNALGGGASNVAVTVTGANIFPGATLVFSNAKVHPVGTATVTAPGSLVQLVSVDSDATPGAGTVKVVNTDDQASPTSPFTVDPAPTISSMSPTQKAAGETFTLTVNGTNFALDPNGARLHFSDSSITAANYVITATQIKADVTVPAAVAASNPATVQVDVVNPDHGQATAPTPLTLNPPPTISSLDPAVAGTNKTFTLHILGNHFNSNATVSSADSSFAVSGVKYISANEIDATVDTNGTSVGAHPVKVDNGDGGTAQHVLNVINPPSAPQGVTVDSGDHGIRVRWSAPASNGGDPVTSYTVTVTKHSDGSAVASYTTPNATTFQRVFFPLTNGVRYDASVVATNHAGNGPAATGNGTPKFATNLSLHRSKHTVSKGQAVTLSGQLLRSDKHGLSGAKVKIYRTLGGHTKRLRTLTTSAGGKWHMTLKPTKTATYHAVFAGDGADAGSVSTSGKVKVRP